jgi:predicted unusual protein kinase regulating ubiquinone biosynthesis (AarF/ABC1/UbiB family)
MVQGLLTCFLALLYAVVNGDTLASLGDSTYHRAAAAALQALTTLQSVDGFLHGDVHLRNIMLVRNDTADDTAATCVFLDLGRAQFGASVEKQQKEREELRWRLKA